MTVEHFILLFIVILGITSVLLLIDNMKEKNQVKFLWEYILDFRLFFGVIISLVALVLLIIDLINGT
jgi:hypothetical protein